MSQVRARVVIEGRVQGVFFRDSTRQEAQRLGVTGWVRNRRDGSVEALLEGEEEKVRALIRWCEQGPPLAQVRRVSVAWEDYQGEFKGFRIGW